MLKTYDLVCNSCLVRETMLLEEAELNHQVCSCGGQMQRVFTVPNVRTSKLSASFVDGQRANSKAFRQLRDQHKLEDAIFDASSREEKVAAEKELARKIKE